LSKNMRGIGAYIAIFVLLVLSLVLISQNQPQQKKTEYSKIMSYFETNDVSSFSLDLGSGQLTLKLKSDTSKTIKYTVPDIQLFTDRIDKLVYDYNTANPDTPITYDYVQAWQAPWWLTWLPEIIFIVVMIVLWMWMINQASAPQAAAR
jgi:cell division protease FtsH